MYFKIALKNVKKSYKDFLIYFLTLAFSVCLFYTFNSFEAQQSVMDMNEVQHDIVASLNMIMGMLSNFVSIVLAFLILYANNFLIKRRKREFGMYMLLGMPKQQISRILVYETLIIGFVSLIVGIGLGLLASQLLTVLTASLFTAKLNYTFVFSMNATIMTIIAFAVIFFIVMIFNTFIISRYKLISLITAGKQNEKPRIQNLWISVLLFIISLCLIGYAYYYAIEKGMLFLQTLGPIIVCGSVGTVLFFLSLSGFLLKFIQSSKSLYYRKLNIFVLRQINSKINSNFLSMSVVCLMLLLSIGALSTGLTLRDTMNDSAKTSTPFDASFATSEPTKMQETMESFINDTRIKDHQLLDTYADDAFTVSKLTPFSKKLQGKEVQNATTYPVDIYKLSEFNEKRTKSGMKPLQLHDNEAYLFSSIDSLTDYLKPVLDKQAQVEVYGKPVIISNKDYELEQLGTGASGLQSVSSAVAIVVSDDIVPTNAVPYQQVWNINYNKGANGKALSDEIQNRLIASYEGFQGSYNYSCNTKETTLTEIAGTSVLFTYIGLYLGIVFLVASAVVLALQQLTEADDSRHRYQVLRKIGAEKRMMNQAVFMQIAIYFFMPLALAIVHSYVGIKVVNTVLVMVGKVDIVSSALATGGIILALYGTYFIITYTGCNRIIQQEKA